MRRIIAVFICAGLLLPAQDQEKTVTFSSSSNLVIVNVEVRDKNGKPIDNLKREDFQVLEDGKAQQLAVFEYESLKDEPAAPLQLNIADVKPAERQKVATPVGATAVNKVRYQDRRLLAMFFDLSSMQVPEQLRAQKSALDYIGKKMGASDLVAVLTNSNKLRVEQDFTSDRETLISVIKGLPIGDAADLAADGDTGDTENGVDTGAAFIGDESEFNIFNTDRKLGALEQACKMLATLPEKKALIYFSSGLTQNGTDNQAQLRSTVNEAVRANVAFYPIDARGLVASAPAGDASVGSQRGSGIFSGQAQRNQREQNFNQQETLYTLAADTGGKAFLDNNDLSLGIQQAKEDVHSYYILGYYSSNPNADGKFRKLKVAVLREGLKASLNYRSGYFAQKQFKQFTEADKEQQLAEALALGDPVTDLRMAMEVDSFRINKDTYFVPVSVKIPAAQITLRKKGSNQVTEFDFIGQIRDKAGKVAGSLRDGIQIKLTEADAASAGKKSFQYNTGFTLPAGEYRVKFLARENESGKMGTYESKFTVPDPNSQGPLHVSSVVWSTQREALTAAVGNAGTKKKLLAIDPLVDNGQRLVPSVTRVFRRDQNLLVYMEIYDPSLDQTTSRASVAANVSFFMGDKKAFESPEVRLSEFKKERRNTLAMQVQIPLAKLVPGQYTCQINVVDEIGRKFAFPRANVAIR